MGGNSSKQSSFDCYGFSAEEKSKLNATFMAISEASKLPNKTGFTYDGLKEFLKDKLNEAIVDHLCNLMKSQSKHQEKEHIVDEYGFSIVLSWILKGTTSNQIILFNNCETNDKDKLIKILEGYVSAFIDVVANEDQIPASIISLKDGSVKLFTRYLLHDLFHPGTSFKKVNEVELTKSKFTESEYESWLMKCPLAIAVISKVIIYYFRISTGSEDKKKGSKVPNFIFPRGHINFTLLDIPRILMLNSNLPRELQDEWTLLFSTVKDGESFSSCAQRILKEGPTLLMVKDKVGNTFGGFASDSWELNPNFTGSDSCFLFSTFPKFGVYGTTGYNDHYMYVNQQQQTLPNGLGMGGQLNYFGLWIDSNFGNGKCSLSCTTFENPMLSSTENFEIDTLEVWRVGPKPKLDEEDEGERSILDKDPEAKAMLMLIGKTPLSEGLRESDPTADSPDDKILPPLI